MLILTIIKKILAFYHIVVKNNFPFVVFFGFYSYCFLFGTMFEDIARKVNYTGYIINNIPLILKIFFLCTTLISLIYVSRYEQFKWQKWHNEFFIKPIFTYHFFRTHSYSIRSVLYDIFTLPIWFLLLDLIYSGEGFLKNILKFIG